MAGVIAQFIALALASAGLVAFTWLTTTRLTPEPKRPLSQRWLTAWFIKGLLLPWLLWSLMNAGLFWWLPPFMPQIQAAQRAGEPWAPSLIQVLGRGLWIVSSYWSGVTLGWLVALTSQTLEPRFLEDFKCLCRACTLGLMVPAGAMCFLGGWPWLGAATMLVLGPIAGYSAALLNSRRPPPVYARAIARMKFGKYTEAEWEIIRELENHEDDFDGWMLLAELYAHHFDDLREAEKTIHELCAQPQVTPSQISVALHRLADWHLKLGQNPQAARRALQRIAERLKDTHLARMALLRMDQIPATAEEFREGQSTTTIPLPALGDALDETPSPPLTRRERQRAAPIAQAYVERLELNPNNTAVREKFARILAERMGRPELAIEQLELLLGMPDQPEIQRAQWLSLIAAWHLKYRQDPEASRKVLEQLAKDLPRMPQALAARRRLELMARGAERRRVGGN